MLDLSVARAGGVRQKAQPMTEGWPKSDTGLTSPCHVHADPLLFTCPCRKLKFGNIDDAVLQEEGLR
jgi:hypothetical protein